MLKYKILNILKISSNLYNIFILYEINVNYFGYLKKDYYLKLERVSSSYIGSWF